LSVSRAQEVAADAISAKVAGTDAAARALVAADARATAWQVYLRTEVEPMLEAGFLPQLLVGFRHFEAALEANREQDGGTTVAAEKASKYDTHPTLEERLNALGVTQPPSAHMTGALDLLDEASAAEEYVLRSMLINRARPLGALAWESAGHHLWLPCFVERLKPHASALAKVTPEALPEVVLRVDDWADRLRTGLALFSPEAKRRHVVMMFGTWFAVHVVGCGFELEALPGWPVRAVLAGTVVEPFAEVSSLFEGKLDSAAWLSRCAAIRSAKASVSDLARG
jgi:hypothetical protein